MDYAEEIEHILADRAERKRETVKIRKQILQKKFMRGFNMHNFKRDDIRAFLQNAFLEDAAWESDISLCQDYLHILNRISKLKIQGTHAFAIIGGRKECCSLP